MKLNVVAYAAVFIGVSCANRPDQKDIAVAGAYQAEQLDCVEKSKTLEESHNCRCVVRAKYNRPCDGGVK